MSAIIKQAGKLRSVSIPGYNHFEKPLRKLIFDYDGDSPGQAGMRAYLAKPFAELAAQNPDVEIVVRKLKRGKAAVIRGHYVNGRDKVICVNNLQANQIQNKVAILLESSGAKIRNLKNDTLEAGPGNESARGVWSALHAQSKDGGYTI